MRHRTVYSPKKPRAAVRDEFLSLGISRGRGNGHLTHKPVKAEIVRPALRLNSRNGHRGVLYRLHPTHLTLLVGHNLGLLAYFPYTYCHIEALIGKRSFLEFDAWSNPSLMGSLCTAIAGQALKY